MLRVLYDFVIRGKKDCVVTFIYYKSAFDSVSHRFIDMVLARANASRKTRAIFRAIYDVATGVVRVNGILGKKIFSTVFGIDRGVVQGDIVSPILFILALDQLIQTYDIAGTGVRCGQELTYRVLGYADDAALVEERIEEMSLRLTQLADASVAQAGMYVRMDKTFTHHVRDQVAQIITEQDIMGAQEKFDHKCDFCVCRFKTKAAMYIHRTSCQHNYDTTDKVCEVEEIRGVFGHVES